MPGQIASSGGIPRNRTRPSFPTPNPQVLPTRSKGEDRNNRDTEILFMPLSYRKHRPATQNNRDTGAYSRRQQSSQVEAPRVELPAASLKVAAPGWQPREWNPHPEALRRACPPKPRRRRELDFSPAEQRAAPTTGFSRGASRCT